MPLSANNPFFCPCPAGKGPGELPSADPEDVLRPTAGPLPGDPGSGERAGASEGWTGHAAPAPQSAAQHQDETGERDHHLQTTAGAGRGQVRTQTDEQKKKKGNEK